MKSVLLSGIAAIAMSATGAFAQSATDASQPAGQAASGQFITNEPEGMYRAPKLVGVAVYDSTNKSIGKIDDLLVDKSGAIKAVVIGVGGFLGIGRKDVAVPYSAIHWQTEQRTVATNDPATGGMAANNGSTTTANSMSNNTGAAHSTNGTATNGTAGNGVANSSMATGGMTAGDKTQTKTIDAAKTEAYQGYPDRAVVDMSQDQLKAAPDFKYASNPASMGDNTATTTKQQ